MELVVFLAVLAVVGIIGTGIALWFLMKSRAESKRVESAKEEANTVITQAEDERRRLLLEAQEEVIRLRTAGENEIKEQRQELNRLERRYLQREEQLEQKGESLENQRKAPKRVLSPPWSVCSRRCCFRW